MENELFQVNYKGQNLKIERFDVGGQALFRISFPGKEPILTILRAVNFNGAKFWVSMPEGRQKLAEEIGILIEQFYRAKI